MQVILPFLEMDLEVAASSRQPTLHSSGHFDIPDAILRSMAEANRALETFDWKGRCGSMTNRYAVDVIDGTFVDDEVSVPMEPRFDSDPHLSEVSEALRWREPVFHREAAGVSHEDRLRGTAPDFREVGANGRRYGRDYVLETLELRYREPVRDVWYVEDFQVREVAEITYLVT